MSLEERIQKDLVTAMKAKDEKALRAIRSIKSAILLYKTSGSGVELNEEAEIKMLQKMVKQRKESLSIYEQQGRAELAQTEKEEIEVIEQYLPKQLSPEDIEALLKDIIAELGATSMKDMGKVMAAANQKFAGQAEGAVVSGIVKRLLA
ncbi:MAG: GatB/YqeY domain-containing protein [Saprospiraceae bacterium]|nr:GatB/YqeY domain-containing protein [Saprospiraceae bacterium]